MNILYKTQKIFDNRTTLQAMAGMALEYSVDVVPFLSLDLFNFWLRVQSLYILETEEQLLRPKFFLQIGGDCDDQAICLLSYLIESPSFNQYEFLYITEAARQPGNFEHVFVEFGNISLDALPGLKFGQRSGRYFKRHRFLDLL